MPRNNQETNSRDTFSYIADQDRSISKYMEEKKKFNDFTVNAKDRSRFSKDEKKKEVDLRQKKRRMLKRKIFPSMANLVVLFEYLKNDPELREHFEEDVKDLFGYVRGDQKRFQEKPAIIRRLISSILTWDMKKDPNNFRLDIMGDMAYELFSFTGSLARKDFAGDFGIDKIIDNDIGRAVSWTKLYASRYSNSDQAKKDREKKPRRPVMF